MSSCGAAAVDKGLHVLPAALRSGSSVWLAAQETVRPLWLADHLCTVRSGAVIAWHEPEPSIRRAELLLAGDVIADGVFGGSAPIRLQAVVPSTLRVLDEPSTGREALGDDDSALWVLCAMAARVRLAEGHRYNVRTAAVVARLARLVVDWCAAFDTDHVAGPHEEGLSLASIADIVGSTRPTVHRNLLDLERANAVVLRRGGITVRDRIGMIRRAAGVEPYVSLDRSTAGSVTWREAAEVRVGAGVRAVRAAAGTNVKAAKSA